MAGWPHRRFAEAEEWCRRTWDEPLLGPPGVGLLAYYLMALRTDVAAALGERVGLDDPSVRLRFSGPADPADDFRYPWEDGFGGWDDGPGGWDEAPDGPTPPADEDAPPQRDVFLSPRIVAAGKVRVRQPDGTLRVYDPSTGRYAD